jgi:hypothetical protein
MSSILSIDASPTQIGKLRKGRPVRVKSGTGFNVVVRPESYNSATKSFSKNKGFQLTLSPEEIEMNKGFTPEQHAQLRRATPLGPEMTGKGIFGKRFDKFLEKHGIKDEAYKVGSYLKTPLKYAIKAGLTAGATALGGAQPELIPFLPAGVAGLTSLADDYIDNPDKYQGKGLYAGNGLYASNMRGRGMHMRSTSCVPVISGRGSSFNTDVYQPQARMSQPLSENFQFQYFLPNFKEIEGSGLGTGLADQQNLIPAFKSQASGENFQFRHFLPTQYQQQ